LLLWLLLVFMLSWENSRLNVPMCVPVL
jgi:hypothetical protein